MELRALAANRIFIAVLYGALCYVYYINKLAVPVAFVIHMLDPVSIYYYTDTSYLDIRISRFQKRERTLIKDLGRNVPSEN